VNQGKICGRTCKEGDRCAMHNATSNDRRSLVGIDRQFETLLAKEKSILKSYEEILIVLNERHDHNEMKIYGIRIYLADPTLVKKPLSYKFITFTDRNKHNANYRLRTIIAKNDTLKDEIEKLTERIGLLKQSIALLEPE
jgi:hypothetical protein